MKTKVLITLFATAFTFFSCKKNNETEVKSDVKQSFNVELEASCSKTDDFALYFSEDGTVNFKDVNAVWAGIKGGNKFEKINFELKDDRIPTHIRMDFGLKKEQDSVVIKNIKINYYNNNFEISGANFFKYFIEDKQFSTKVDGAKGTLTIYQKDGVYKTPYYYPNQELVNAIKKITSTK